MVSRYIPIVIMVALVVVSSIVTILIATPPSIKFIDSGPRKFVYVYHVPLDFCLSTGISDVVIVGIISSVEELYEYIDGELRFYYNVSVDVVENLKPRGAQSSKETVSFIAPGRGLYHVVIELYTSPPVRAEAWIRSNGFTSWVDKIISFPLYSRVEQLSPDKVVVEKGLKNVGECKSFITYSGASGKLCVLRSIESSWREEFPVERKVVLFLAKNEMTGYLHLDIKLDIIDDKAILTHRSYVYPVEDENTFSYKDIVEKIKLCLISN